jgi:hypothetical protein
MEWVLGFGVIVVLWFLITHFSGNPSFWKLTRQHPKEAWAYFNSKPEWHVRYKPQEIKVTGPFQVVNPEAGELVTVYCNSDKIETSQAEFVRLMKR